MAEVEGPDEGTRASITTGEVASVVGGRLIGDPEVELGGISHDSGRIEPGWLFCAVVGARHDGGDFAAEAIGSGAAAVLTQRPLDVAVPQILVGDVRIAMAAAARAIHHDPARHLTMVGVTGTNGKTTVVAMLGRMLTAAGFATATMGTLSGARTTPESTDLQSRLAALADSAITHVVMEVSSHALSMHRVDGMVFDVAVFTNLGRDHLDFHRTQEEYFAAKARLFAIDMCERAVLNTDDVHGRLLADTVEVPVQTYGLGDLEDLEVTGGGSRFTWRHSSVELPLQGRHNVSNALAAAEAALLLGVPAATIVSVLGSLDPIPGRFEVLERVPGRPTVVVDYAHTPDALAAVLDAADVLRHPGGELVVVFGCGGERERAKRSEMGAVATAGADLVVVTTDNPRKEDPGEIIAEVLTGCDDSAVVEPDRASAIALAIDSRGEQDVVVVAGKGHETTQELADRTEDFDDRVVARSVLAGSAGSTQ